MRATKNYYREEVKKSKLAAYNCLPDIIKKYGIRTKISPRKSYYRIYLNNDDYVEGYNRGTSWWIRGFELDSKGTIYIMVYWQGDSTDGDEYIKMPPNLYTNAYLEPPQPVNMGSYYYVARQGISISPNEIWDAIKYLKL
jgi:hypothetical protein